MQEQRPRQPSLRIYGDLPDIDEISETLDLTPTIIQRKGELNPRFTGNKQVFSRDMWLYKSPVPEDRPLDVHIQKLWSLIKSHSSYLLNLKEKATVDIFCGYRSNSCTAGFEVSPSSLEMFIQLDIPFGVSVIVA